MSRLTLEDLEGIIAERARSGDDGSWTAKLMAGGMELPARKLGEEAVETVVAAMAGDRAAIVSESADLIYHWLVVLAKSGVRFEEVLDELSERTGRSGIEEKAARRRS